MTIATEHLPVCRDVHVTIPNRFSGGGVIESEPIRERTWPLEDYLALVQPKKKVEYLSRTQIAGVDFLPITSLFFSTLKTCFCNHYCLALRPDVLMHLIVNEIAITVKQNADDYRALFTESREKITIRVRNDSLRRGDPESPWVDVLPMFEKRMRERIPSGIANDLLPPFSMTTPESRAASIVAFMDAASPFYDYHCATLCGIPDIRLLGEAADYQTILDAARRLAGTFEQHLKRYFEHLLPVLETLTEQAEGAEIDEEFWRSIFTYDSDSGGPSCCSGWMSAFVNYVQLENGTFVPKVNAFYDWRRPAVDALNLEMLPKHICSVPFEWDYFGTVLPMSFVGGILGVDNLDGYLTPALSYGVLYE